MQIYSITKRTTHPQGENDTFAKSAAYTEQALAKFEQCLRELTSLVGKVEQYIAEKLEKGKQSQHEQQPIQRYRMW